MATQLEASRVWQSDEVFALANKLMDGGALNCQWSVREIKMPHGGTDKYTIYMKVDGPQQDAPEHVQGVPIQFVWNATWKGARDHIAPKTSE